MSALLQPGSQINQYRVVKHLGTGAFAEVYLATHTFLNVDRAIKVLDRHSPNITPDVFDSYVQRYKLEWQLAASVHHPNLVEVYDLFQIDDASYAVVEYAPNGTLKDILDVGNRHSEDWVVEVLRDCAAGLERLHQLTRPQMVHCYVNPKTIVFDKNGKAKISNFGRVRSALRRRQGKHRSLTDDYDSQYHAPELERGKVAPTTDIHSLGCVAFEMLTGRSAVSARVRCPRQIEPSVPEWLDKIVSRMLCDTPGFSKLDVDDVNKRYVDIPQLLKALNEPRQRISDQLLDQLIKHFSLNEPKTICFDLEIDHEIIEANDKQSYGREMIRYCQRRENIGTLIERLRLERPEVPW